MRGAHACRPTWLALSSIVVSAAVCTGSNPRYLGVVQQPPVDAGRTDTPGAQPDAAPPEEDAEPPGPDLALDGAVPDAAPEAATPDAPSLNPDLSADAEPPDPAPTAGLVAHWPLDEGQGVATADLTGNQNDGALINGPTWIGGAAPITRTNPMALRLDGSNDHVDLTVRTLPRAEASKTIGVWFRNAAQTPRLRNLVAFFNEGQDTGIHLGLDGDKVAVWRFGDFDPIAVSTQTPDTSWHHLAYSWDGTRHLLYLDGAMVGSSSVSIPAGAIQTARFGTWELPEEVFGGDIDEVRVYDRALSAPEITALAGRR